jgi:cytochrome c-type biogenesis protein
VLPLFPSYLSFITGMSVSDLSADLSPTARRRVLLHALAFIVGFSLVFVALGASFSAAGQLLVEYRPWIRRIGGLLIIVFGLYIAGVFRLGLLGRTLTWQVREKPAGYVGTFLVGITFAVGWTPCVGPILGAILTLASTTETVQWGVGLLLAYSAGLGVPFLLSALAVGSFLRWFRHYRPFIPVVERVAGVLLVVVGVLVYTNYYVYLNNWAISLTPEWLLERL